MIRTTYSKLEKKYQKLLDVAEKVMKNGYAPYSKFYVGSAVLSKIGKIYSGTNIETASYVAICAERSAISNAIANGDYEFEAIAVICKSDNFNVIKVAGPCGICRQLIFEFSEISGKDIVVINSTTQKDKIVVANISELIPMSFGPVDTEADVRKYKK